MKNSLSSGVTLLEFLIYFSLLISMSFLLFQGASMFLSKLKKTDNKVSFCVALHAAADALSRDIRSAPRDRALWQFCEPQKIQWQAYNRQISWYEKKGKLYRAQRVYDERKKKWGKETTGVVSSGLLRVVFDCVMDNGQPGSIRSVRLFLEHNSQETVHGLVAIRNQKSF